MTLREYLYKNNLSIHEFAVKIQYHGNYVSRVMRGLHTPSERFIFSVDIATKSQIKAEDIRDRIVKEKVKNLVV